MDVYEKLQKAGLTGNEARIYLELLKNGELSANNISKNISMDRTLTYTVLNHLIEKGQVNYIVKENKKFFSCANPENLMNPIKSSEVMVLDLIKELKSVKRETKAQTEINVYEGKEAIRSIFNLFKKHKEMISFGATGRAYDYLYESPVMANELVKAGMKGRIITSRKHSNHPMAKIKNVETRFVNYDSEATTTIFGDYVMIHLAKDKPMIILIKNKDISNSYRNHFEVLWKSARKKP